MTDLNPNVWGGIFEPLPQPEEEHEQHFVAGYRVCSVGCDESGILTLTALTAAFNWVPGINRAVCGANRPHKAPAKGCHCGLYGCATLAAVLHAGGRHVETSGNVLVGIIGSGDIVLHEHGWRAEEAQIVAIGSAWPRRIIKRMDGSVIKATWAAHGDLELLASLGARYEVPVVDLAELQKIVIARSED